MSFPHTKKIVLSITATYLVLISSMVLASRDLEKSPSDTSAAVSFLFWLGLLLTGVFIFFLSFTFLSSLAEKARRPSLAKKLFTLGVLIFAFPVILSISFAFASLAF
jgi:F0F1-type ATP synthase membrane subunit c/vacuolar-type H+-ATPase subunit K